MPFAVRLPDVKNPCLLDADGNMVRLSRAELADVPTVKTSDSAVYWGVLPRVAFDEGGAHVFAAENARKRVRDLRSARAR